MATAQHRPEGAARRAVRRSQVAARRRDHPLRWAQQRFGWGISKPLRRYSKWRPSRTATISSIAPAKTCWTIVSDTASASSLRSRSLQVVSPSRARSSIRSPRPTTPRRARLLSLGFSSAARLCFPFRALRGSRIWRKMLRVDIRLSDGEFAALDRAGRTERAS